MKQINLMFCAQLRIGDQYLCFPPQQARFLFILFTFSSYVKLLMHPLENASVFFSGAAQHVCGFYEGVVITTFKHIPLQRDTF